MTSPCDSGYPVHLTFVTDCDPAPGTREETRQTATEGSSHA
jgi:hypothetical protein